LFTGLIQAVGTVEAIDLEKDGSTRFWLRPEWSEDDLVIGESIAVSGCCLSLAEERSTPDGKLLGFDLGQETLDTTRFKSLKISENTNQKLNLERSLRLGDRLGGHFVTGHVDSLCTLESKEQKDGSWVLWWKISDSRSQKLLVEKGSICIDGVSLTVNDVEADRFSVCIIPITWQDTNVAHFEVGADAHIEFDLLAKHVAKLASK